LSLIVSTKIGNQPWSWEESFVDFINGDLPKLGDIYDVKKGGSEYYQAHLVKCEFSVWYFRFIGFDKGQEEQIDCTELSKRVFQRGSHTNGFHKIRDASSKSLFLYPPYPMPTIVENKNIKLSTYFEIISIIEKDLPKWKARSDINDSNLLHCLCNDKLCRDITFELKGGVTLEAHRTVLAVRSPVFRKMLTSDMVESKSGKVELLDVDPLAMKIFIDGLYDIGLPETMTPDVWEAVAFLCDKYQVHSFLSNLLLKIGSMPPGDILFSRLFDTFRKIPHLERYFLYHKRAFVNGVLKIPAKKRTKAMRDFLFDVQIS
jgi:hypothetical protein